MSDGLEPMQVDDHPEENENDKSLNGVVGPNGLRNACGEHVAGESDQDYVVMNPTIDLETYIQAYSGFARIFRLRFIAQHCPPLRLEALKTAVNDLMVTHNTVMFEDTHKKLMDALAEQDTSSAPADSGHSDLLSTAACQAMIKARNKGSAIKLERLDINSFKANGIKESSRRGFDDLGEHYLDCGKFESALRFFTTARNYCTSPNQKLQSSINIVKVLIYSQNWNKVWPIASEGIKTHTDTTNLSPHTTTLHCALGLAELALRQYESAAKYLLNAELDHCTNTEFLSPQNVAIYCCLCALATFERSQIRKDILGSQSFKLFLDLDPQLREAINDFCASKYTKCFSMLSDMRENLLLDLYLGPHVDTLFSLIRNKSIVQYLSPYLSADLRLMAEAFNTPLNELEDELITLILNEKIQGRIDSHNKVLYRQGVDIRTQTFERAMEVATAHKRWMRMMILRSAILKSQVIVKSKQTRKPKS